MENICLYKRKINFIFKHTPSCPRSNSAQNILKPTLASKRNKKRVATYLTRSVYKASLKGHNLAEVQLVSE
ncbi:hypothetical protein QBD01_001502 [Ochrobactrum sp. 19YEA23]|nr:hypothetical protein [Ochrobactrum sp. 19YEA23]